MRPASDPRPLVAHIVHRFDTGGLENGVVNLINHMPRGAYRHMVVALTEVTDFRHRLADPTVACVALHKPPGTVPACTRSCGICCACTAPPSSTPATSRRWRCSP